MEHKDIWLVLGLTVILAVAVSLSTVSLSGNAIITPTKKVQSVCIYVDANDDSKFVQKNADQVCIDNVGKLYTATYINAATLKYYFSDSNCQNNNYMDIITNTHKPDKTLLSHGKGICTSGAARNSFGVYNSMLIDVMDRGVLCCR